MCSDCGSYFDFTDPDSPPVVTVTAAADWLDEVSPQWFRLVQPETLEMWNGSRCILGQVFRAEAAASWHLSGYTYGLHLLNNQNQFFPGAFSDERTRDIWLELIAIRRLLRPL